VEFDDAFIASLGFGELQRPPQLWPFRSTPAALTEFLSSTISDTRLPVAQLTLNVSNVVISEEAAGEGLPAGEFVAFSIVAPRPWLEDRQPTGAYPNSLGQAAGSAGAVSVYSRHLVGGSALVALFPRDH
jgi:hypothetical protein